MLIANGQVMVDGKVELRKRCKIRQGQIISFNNYQVQVS
jgi:ribosome-associated protein